MMCLGFKSLTAGWYAQTNPLNYVAPPTLTYIVRRNITVPELTFILISLNSVAFPASCSIYFCFFFKVIAREPLRKETRVPVSHSSRCFNTLMC